MIPGAEPFSADGGPHGALVLHGFTGNPHSMRGVAEALAARRVHRRAARCCPGHGTDGRGHDPDRLGRLVGGRRGGLRRSCAPAGDAGASWSPACRWAGRSPRGSPPATPRSPGSSCINPARRAARTRCATSSQALARPGQGDRSRHRVRHRRPRRRRAGLRRHAAAAAADAVRRRRRASGRPRAGSPARCSCCTSPQDHVVPPSNSDHLADAVSRPGRAGHARAQLPRRHPRLRQGPHRGAQSSSSRRRSSPAETGRAAARPSYACAAVPERITRDEVAHVARLARLELTDDELERSPGSWPRSSTTPPTSRRSTSTTCRRPRTRTRCVNVSATRRGPARRSTATRCSPPAPDVEDGRFRVPPILGEAP